MQHNAALTCLDGAPANMAERARMTYSLVSVQQQPGVKAQQATGSSASSALGGLHQALLQHQPADSIASLV
jgi:hypothetical protein